MDGFGHWAWGLRIQSQKKAKVPTQHPEFTHHRVQRKPRLSNPAPQIYALLFQSKPRFKKISI
ncbi:hypothetical protein ABE29_17505 [Cytobacillus firmus]|nr:hypothetical protein [Cytobacillus firmus]MBG9551937.1 hypothetical protein [Cytobacillus firmus]MBG9555198.1 hypothetical protein [Cytobacillus firmus]MBG9573529.1 hypothetical protein [Cytobacillus firmus]